MLFSAGTRIYCQSTDNDSNNIIHGCIKPNILTTHPFGLFESRIDHNLKAAPANKWNIQFDFGSGNVWLPPVVELYPRSQAALAHLNKFPWHKKDSVYQHMVRDHDSNYIAADGVIKTFKLRFEVRISKRSELNIELRSFLLTNGSFLYSVFTNDAAIEAFHKYIAGGVDVFARDSYPYNRAFIDYYDPRGKSMHLKSGSFIIPGIQFAYFYYPDWNFLKKNNLNVNAGVHAGFNTSIYNRSIDIGLSTNFIKTFGLTPNKFLICAGGGSILRQKLIGNGIAYTTQNYLKSFETQIEYRISRNSKRFHSCAVNFYLQSPYKDPKKLSDFVAIGRRSSPHWYHTFYHAYEYLQNWTFIYSFKRNRWITSLYVKEDFKVDNAPDIQTGISVKYLANN